MNSKASNIDDERGPPVQTSSNPRLGSETLELVIEAAGLGVFEHDPRNNSFRFNDRLIEILGISPFYEMESVIPNIAVPTPCVARSLTMNAPLRSLLACIHPDDLCEFIHMAETLALPITGPRKLTERQFRVVHSSGEVRFVHFQVLQMDAIPKRSIGVVRDMTDSQNGQLVLVEKCNALDCENQKLTIAMRWRDDFLAVMGHDLRSTLTAALGMSEILKEEVLGAMTPPQRDAVEVVHASGLQLLNLINTMVDIAKLKAGKLVLKLSRTSIDSLCLTSLKTIESTARRRNVSVSYRSNATDDSIYADSNRLKLCLVNLLVHAVKRTPTGGSMGIEVSVDNATARTNFIVWDTRITRTRDATERKSESGRRRQSMRIDDGDGHEFDVLLSKLLVELHGGTVQIDSPQGTGKRVCLSIPSKIAQ